MKEKWRVIVLFVSMFIFGTAIPVAAVSDTSENIETAKHFSQQTKHHAKALSLSMVESLASGQAIKQLKEHYSEEEQQAKRKVEEAQKPTLTQIGEQKMRMEATAYSYNEGAIGGGYMTATGQNLREQPMAVAVDPSVIPLGTRVYVEGYGEAIASDTGGAIQGNIIDLHFSDVAQCIAWGRRQVEVTIL